MDVKRYENTDIRPDWNDPGRLFVAMMAALRSFCSRWSWQTRSSCLISWDLLVAITAPLFGLAGAAIGFQRRKNELNDCRISAFAGAQAGVSEGRADSECQLHAATVTVVFELFHDAIGRRADESGAFSAPLGIGHVAGFETKHQIPEGALFT